MATLGFRLLASITPAVRPLLSAAPSRTWSPAVMSVMPQIQFQQTAGLKFKALLHKRCKACYFEVINERLYVQCPLNPRHRAVQKQSNPNTRVQMTLTHATQGGKNRQKGRGRREMWTQQSFRMDF